MKSVMMSGRQQNTEHTKASNAGFSLVELLIAVVILAIIAIPMLHMFVTSTNLNVKSRQTLRATTVAQDIMEGLKAYTLEEVRTQFAPPEGVSGSSYYYPSNGFYVLNTNLISGEGGVREIAELKNPNKEIYYFGIKNLKMQGGEYDALIRLDASTYGADSVEGVGGGGTPAAGAHDNEFNGTFYAEIGSVSETGGNNGTDSSYHEDKALNEAVLKNIKKQIKDAGLIPPADEADWDHKELSDFPTKRDIVVNIADAGSTDAEGNPQCKATITFKYEYVYNGNTYTSYGYGNPGLAQKDEISVARTFSSGNFYLFYYPIYRTGVQVDHIMFDIDDAGTLFQEDSKMLKSITVAKQIRSTVDAVNRVIIPEMTEDELYYAEDSYCVTVDATIDNAGSMGETKLLFKSNLEKNMGTNPLTHEKGEDIENGDVLLNLGADTHIALTDMSGDNISSKITNVIYDIEITVYETGAADHFTEANFENNDEVHRLAFITNLN